ncbi:MAG: 16S rRNA (cytosine(1402)-N(4))-methyltransferase RsmH [Bacteroidales bacterium]|nr:16S rRNA (cytosine(1402)-N(4))-methyltransferase RsmH [Candidatus Cryptobacteroides onthequi]MCQ2163841.1 16S rRNA (cytosine(1402)-N(4))-methyltransferase RsmH [Bacteroidales bacterium]
MSEYHTPVLLDESVSALVTSVNGSYADATFGGGGHSAEILSRLGPQGSLMGFDRDTDAIRNGFDDPRFKLIHNNFRFIHNYSLLEGRQFDGILADLGVSSHQFDTAERGFSFRFDAALDMRMNTQGGKTAASVINTYSQEELERIFRLYGELDNAGKAARLIFSARANGEILTTTALNAVLAPVTPSFAEHKYLAKVYQALRIEVNDEMRSLEKFLQGAAESLRPGGRLVVITYHSLEDRMVKNFIKAGNIDGEVKKDFYGRTEAPLQAVNRKPILPCESEIASNTRARSAKLRIAEKI